LLRTNGTLRNDRMALVLDRHNGATLQFDTLLTEDWFSVSPHESEPATRNAMPSLFRFLLIISLLVAVTYGSLYVLAVYFEPDQTEVQKPLPTITIRR
jgi:hypothetical protein